MTTIALLLAIITTADFGNVPVYIAAFKDKATCEKTLADANPDKRKALEDKGVRFVCAEDEVIED